VQYYNLTIGLNVLADGKIDTSAATITSVLSPNYDANKFIAGTYVDAYGTRCTVVTTVLQGGRTEASFSCKTTDNHVFQANWVTGLIPGHPFELELRDASIQSISGYGNYSWGKIANSDSWWWGGQYAPSGIISARQIGNTLAIGLYGDDNVQDSGVNLTKQ
jgi:hypothetical protein